VRIEQINIDNPQYKELVDSRGCAFNSPDWLGIFGKELMLFGIFNGNDLQGSFHLYKKNKGILQLYLCPPFTPHIGFVYDSKANNTSKKLSENKEAIALVAAHLDTISGGLVSCAFAPEVIDMQPFIWKKFKVIPGYTYRLNLSESIADIEARMSAQHRNAMKKAERDGVECRITSDYSIVKSLVEKTFERKNKELNGLMIDKILKQFANDKNSFALVSWQNGIPIATAFCIYDKSKVYYLLGGYDPLNKHSGAGILCVYNSILEGQRLKKNIFDFEGSMLPEVEKYFRGFGPDLHSYFTVNKAGLLLEMALKVIKRHQF
jgi:hypothetical protein